MTEEETTSRAEALLDRHSDESLLRMVKRHKKDADQHLATWRDEARECYDFRSGEHWTPTEKSQLQDKLRAPVVFNRVGPMVEAVAGAEVNNRQAVQYIPRKAGDAGLNEVLTSAADYFRDACDAEDEESDAFMDVVICGIGVTETSLDYVDNPDGMIKVERRDPLSMRWDPSAKKRNLSDKKWCQREEWLDEDEIHDRWPEKADEISGASTGWRDDEGKQPHDSTLAWLYQKDDTGHDITTGKHRVIHEQWYELETYYLIADFSIDPMTQQMVYGQSTVEMQREEYETLESRLERLGIPLRGVKKQRKRWYQVFVCGDTILEFGEVACNACAFNFITGYRDRNRNVWFGIVRAMIDPQKWANKFFSQFLHIINTNAKGGLVIEKGVTDNISRFKEDWSKSEGVTEVNDGALSRKKLMPKPPPAIPPQMAQMMEFAISSLRDVSGLNLEILGMANREQAGVLEMQRKQAALTVLATIFDALRRYRKEQGRLFANYIVEYVSDGRLIRLVGGDGTEKYVPLMREQGALDFDVIVDESPSTPNQKNATFAILMQLLPALEKMGVPFVPDLLEFTPLPSAMVDKWQQAIQQKMAQQQQNPGPPPPQMLSAMANMKRADAAVMAAQSKAQKDQIDAQHSGMKMQFDARQAAMQAQQSQQQAAQDAYAAPYEMQVRMRELAVQEQELRTREMEAQASIITAQANARMKAMQSLGLDQPASQQ